MLLRNCGECLMNTVDVVELGAADGICPKCGTDYGPPEAVCVRCHKGESEHRGTRRDCPMSKTVKPGSTFTPFAK